MTEEHIYSKQELLTALASEFHRWEKLLDSLSEAQIATRNLPADLSIKDIVAHLWAWQQLSIARLDAALHHRAPDFRLGPERLDPDKEENLDRINAWIHETNLDRSWREVYRDWRDGFLHFMDLAQAIPEDDLMERGKYPWFPDYPLSAVLGGSWTHHHEEHYEPLAAWLKERGHVI